MVCISPFQLHAFMAPEGSVIELRFENDSGWCLFASVRGAGPLQLNNPPFRPTAV